MATEFLTAQQLLDDEMIIAAGKHNDLEKVRELLKSGANINGRLSRGGSTALSWTAAGNRIELMEFLLSNGANMDAPGNAGFSSLGCAAFRGQLEAVKFLLVRGANPNPTEPGNFGVMLSATFSGNEDIVRILISAGSDVNVQTSEGTFGPFWFHAPYCGETPLHYAMAYGSQGMIQALVYAGADLCATTRHGETAFHWAGRHQRPKELMRWLHTLDVSTR